MSVIKRLVCLTNSRKLSGRCIAGKELVEGSVAGWIRPVSDRPKEEVSEYERQYEDGSDPRVMDIVEIPLLQPKPNGHQQENWLLDPEYYWIKTGKAKWADLERFADPPEPLWVDESRKIHGRLDRIDLAAASVLTSSLRLIHVEKLTLSVFVPGETFGNTKRRVQGRFRHCHTDYCFWVTDPVYERTYLAKPDGNHHLGESFLTVSLGEPFNGYCYKLIAAIFERTKIKDEERSAVRDEERAAVRDEDRAAVRDEDRATVQGEDRATVQGEDRAAVRDEDRATVQGEDRAAVQGEDRAAVQGEDRAPVQDEDRAAVQDEERAAVQDEERAAVQDEERAAVQDEERAAVQDEERAAVQDEERAAVQDEERAAVQDEERAAVRDEERAAVPDEERAAVPDEERAAVPDELPSVGDPAYPLGRPDTGIQGDDRSTLFTVGHSTHSLEVFLDLLRKHDISAIADVRSAPYSRYCPQFNKDALAHSIKEHGIKYVFLGRELGARSDDQSCYENGRVRYSRLAEQKAFRDGIERLKKGAERHRIALMCAEREPLECHRTLLVSRALDQEGFDVEHIHADGHLERHRDAVERLFDIVGLSWEDLIRSKEELVVEAYSRQEERVAYKGKSLAADETGQAP